MGRSFGMSPDRRRPNVEFYFSSTRWSSKPPCWANRTGIVQRCRLLDQPVHGVEGGFDGWLKPVRLEVFVCNRCCSMIERSSNARIECLTPPFISSMSIDAFLVGPTDLPFVRHLWCASAQCNGPEHPGACGTDDKRAR